MKFKSLLILSVLTLRAHGAYENHIKAYYEYCGTTQWKTTDGQVGGSTGHAFNYVHGLCKNYSEKFPQVVPCDDLTAEERSVNPHDGVGISLDKNFSNVKWIAVPGRDLMFFGGMERRATTKTDLKRLIKTATDLRVFEGVEYLAGKNPGTYGTKEYEENAVVSSLGTDIAVNWARTLYCARIPVSRDALRKTADYLNSQNVMHRNTPYKWSMLANNCVHLAINTGNALGLNSAIKTDRFILEQLLNLAVPGNGYMMYADLGVINKPTYGKVKRAFIKNGVSPLQVGSLLLNYEAFPSGEDFVTEGLGLQTLPRVKKPLKLFMTPEKYERFLTPERTDLKANASVWAKLYTEYLLKAQKLGESQEFVDYLQNQLDLAHRILAE